jgi:hypothetical protein
MSEMARESQTLRVALDEFSRNVAALQSVIALLTKQIGDDDVPQLSGDQIESAWGKIRSRYEQVEAKFVGLAESAEDAMDTADALAARAEGGKPISLADLKAELGIE